MAAASSPRPTIPAHYTRRAWKQKGSTIIYPGTIVCTNAGYAVPGTAATGLKAKGIAAPHPDQKDSYDTTGLADGAATVNILGSMSEEGPVGYWLANDTVAAVTQAHVGGPCYIKDNQTVSSDGTDRSECGEVLAVDTTKGVLVKFPI